MIQVLKARRESVGQPKNRGPSRIEAVERRVNADALLLSALQTFADAHPGVAVQISKAELESIMAAMNGGNHPEPEEVHMC